VDDDAASGSSGAGIREERKWLKTSYICWASSLIIRPCCIETCGLGLT
jgi:hypothetical protein